MRNKILILALALSMSAVGCGLGTAAKLMKSYRISLGAFQDAEISAFQAGFVTPDHHKHMQADVEKLGNYGIIADTALLKSDKATLTQDVANAMAAVQEAEANDVTAIGDATHRAAVEAAVGALQNLLAQVQIQLGVK